MIRRLHRDEGGVAMIMSILVAFVVLTLSIYMIEQATRSQQQAARDRKRLTAISAAEAGVNWYFNHFENSGVTTLQSSHSGEVISGPNSVSFTASATYYSDSNGTTLFAGAPSATNYPRSAKIVSTGTASDGSNRTMEAFMALRPIYGGYEGALIANSNTSFSNNFTVAGNNGNDGDILVLTGNFSAPSGLQSIAGSIYVSAAGATASIGTNVRIYGSVWAHGAVTINNPQSVVDGDAKSTSAGVSVPNGLVKNNAYYCTGVAPSNVNGSKVQTCSLGSPPSTTFPQVKFVQSAWEADGYQVVTFTAPNACTNARTYVEGTVAGTTYNRGLGLPAGKTGVVVYINDTCAFTTTNNATISMNSNLAIVTRGSITLSQRSTWNGVTSTRKLFFLSAYPDAGAPSCPTQDITVGNNTSFNALTNVSVYTGCTATMNNNNSQFYGQVIGATLSIGNLFSMTYRPVLIPGAQITGFRQDVAYIREQ
jgi:hypothetical protein